MKEWKIKNHVCWFVEDEAIKPNIKDIAESQTESATLLVELIFCYISVILHFFFDIDIEYRESNINMMREGPYRYYHK